MRERFRVSDLMRHVEFWEWNARGNIMMSNLKSLSHNFEGEMLAVTSSCQISGYHQKILRVGCQWQHHECQVTTTKLWNDMCHKIWDSGGSVCRWFVSRAHLSELPGTTSAWPVATSDVWRFVYCVDHEIQQGIVPTVFFPTRELRAFNLARKSCSR
jgi:hypothetical protein